MPLRELTRTAGVPFQRVFSYAARMIPVLSRAQMRAFDRLAIESCSVPSLILMENAGRGASEVAHRILRESDGRLAVVVAGPGNNGGDGFVLARHLRSRGARVKVYLVGNLDRMTTDCRVQRDAWVGLGGECRSLVVAEELSELEDSLGQADLTVDALFGTGLDRVVQGTVATVIEAINRCARRVLALDVPSGIDADTGVELGVSVLAHDTATFGHLKLGLLTPSGLRRAGRIHRVGLGIFDDVVLGTLGSYAELVERCDVARMIPPRPVDAHKFTAGSVLVLGGSGGKSGAALLASRGALRAGAGLVTVGTWSESHASLDGKIVEVMVSPLPRGDGRSLEEQLRRLLSGRRAVVIGPGFGLDDDAARVIEQVLSSVTVPVVLDADALTLVAERLGGAAALQRSSAPLVLTPHAGEAARLLGCQSADIERDRFGSACTLAALTSATVVLKGAHTLVASGSGRLVVNGSGNPLLATAGSGDVLAGMIGALACALPAYDAAVAAVYVHGRVGDVSSARWGDRGLLASEIADAVPSVLASLDTDSGEEGIFSARSTFRSTDCA